MNDEYEELHPMVKKIYALGCKSKPKISLAIKLFCDLCEVKGMWDTQCIYNSKFDLIYLTGKWRKNDPTPEIVVPFPYFSSLTPSFLSDLQDELCPEGERKIITLAFVTEDSSITYYQAEDGLHPPDSPETVRKRRNEEERRHCKSMEMIRKAHEMLSEIFESEKVEEDETNE